MHYAFHDFIGNIGLVLLLGTYLLLQMGKIDSTRPLYSLLNALAALLIGVSLLFAFNMSAFLVEAFWFVISLYGIINCLRRRSARAVKKRAYHRKDLTRFPSACIFPPLIDWAYVFLFCQRLCMGKASSGKCTSP